MMMRRCDKQVAVPRTGAGTVSTDMRKSTIPSIYLRFSNQAVSVAMGFLFSASRPRLRAAGVFCRSPRVKPGRSWPVSSKSNRGFGQTTSGFQDTYLERLQEPRLQHRLQTRRVEPELRQSRFQLGYRHLVHLSDGPLGDGRGRRLRGRLRRGRERRRGGLGRRRVCLLYTSPSPRD